ncbi:hypothetical protein Tco_0832989, partial [Tanacetum coccineum]
KQVTQQNLPQNRKQAEIHSNVLKPGMYRIATSTKQNREPQLPHASRNTNPHVSKSIGVTHHTSVSRPQPKSYQVKDKVVPNNSQVKFTKKEVEDHHRISSISKKTKSVTACNDSLNSRTSNMNAVCAECGKCVWVLQASYSTFTGKVESEPTHGSNVDIPHIHACKQTLGLSAEDEIFIKRRLNKAVQSSVVNVKWRLLKITLQASFLNVQKTFEQRSSSLVLYQKTFEHSSSSLGRQCHKTSVHISSGLVLHQMTFDCSRSSLGLHGKDVVRLGINPMIQPELEDLPKDNPKLEIEVLRTLIQMLKGSTKGNLIDGKSISNEMRPYGSTMLSTRVGKFSISSESKTASTCNLRGVTSQEGDKEVILQNLVAKVMMEVLGRLLGDMVALQVTGSGCRFLPVVGLLVLQFLGASFTQGTVSSIPIIGNISPKGFLPPILLLVVIIVMVVIVAVILVVVVVAIIGVVVVVSGVSSIIKLLFVIIGFLLRIVFCYLIH